MFTQLDDEINASEIAKQYPDELANFLDKVKEGYEPEPLFKDSEWFWAERICNQQSGRFHDIGQIRLAFKIKEVYFLITFAFKKTYGRRGCLTVSADCLEFMTKDDSYELGGLPLEIKGDLTTDAKFKEDLNKIGREYLKDAIFYSSEGPQELEFKLGTAYYDDID